MNSIEEKLAGMRWLFIKPGKFFDHVARNGSYRDCLIHMALLSVLIGIGLCIGDRSLTPDIFALEAAKDSLAVFAALVVFTCVWGLFAALLGLRLRPRIAAVITFKEALPRSMRVVSFALTPLALLILPGAMFLGLALLGVLVLSVIGVSKALSLKIIPSLIVQAIVLGGIIGASAFALKTFVMPPPQAPEAATPEYVQSEFPARSLIGKAAPDMLIQPTGGTPLHLSDLKGKNIVIIDFWATWCMPCRIGLPMVSEVAAKYKDRGVVFYAIGDGAINQEKLFLEQRNIAAIPSSTDIDGLKAFHVRGIPQTVVIGKDGIVKSVHIGLSSNEKEELTNEIEAALQGK